MGWFGPSASTKARRARELEEAFGEGYDEAEERRQFAAEERAREQSELEEAFGEGYDPAEEARLFADEHEAENGAPRGRAFGPSAQSLTSLQEESEEEVVVTTSPRKARSDHSPSPSSRSEAEPSEPSLLEEGEPSTSFPEVEPSKSFRRRFPRPAPETSQTKTKENKDQAEKGDKKEKVSESEKVKKKAEKDKPQHSKPSQLSLPPIDLGDPARYLKLRETLGVEASLRTPLTELLAPLERSSGDSSDKINPDLFVPTSMPTALLLPFAQHEAYGRLKLKEVRQEDGSIGFALVKKEEESDEAKPG